MTEKSSIFKVLGGKIITGVKNENVRIKFIDKFYWAFTLCIAIGIGAILAYQVLPSDKIGIVCVAFFISIIITVILLLLDIQELYIEHNFIIYKNKLGVKKYIDINKTPLIYLKENIGYYNESSINHRAGESYNIYYIYISQGKQKIKLNASRLGKLNEFIDNLELKDREDLSRETRNEISELKKLQM